MLGLVVVFKISVPDGQVAFRGTFAVVIHTATLKLFACNKGNCMSYPFNNFVMSYLECQCVSHLV